jgi:hypothetical protein
MVKKIIPIIGSFGALGFYRGTQLYKYNYNKELEYYNEKLEEHNKMVEENKKNIYKYTHKFSYGKPYFFYSETIMSGFLGIIFYINPFLFPLVIAKEIYRLEINMRDELDKLKDEDKYYRFL